MPSSRQHIDLRGIESQSQAQEFKRTLTLEVEPVHQGGQDYYVSILGNGVEFKARKAGGDYLIEVSLEVRVSGVCVRCLKDIDIPLSVHETEFVPGIDQSEELGPEQGEDEEPAHVQDFVVDIRGFAREAVVLSLPLKILCGDDCLGLCAMCGADLNAETCECEKESSDSRWDALKDLDLDPDADS